MIFDASGELNIARPALERLLADCLKAYMQAHTTSPEDFAKRVARDWELWDKVVRDNNFIMKSRAAVSYRRAAERALEQRMVANTLFNPVKRRMAAGEVALGLNVRLARSPDIARIAKASGHDFLFIDTQHSIFDLETIAHIAHTALAIEVAPLVRVRGIDDPDVSLLLDNGVAGIVYPDVGSAAQARRAVEVCKFPPLGRRSVAGGYPHFDYRSVPLKESVPALNDSCLLVCMIETVEGLQNVEAIAAVDGVDVVHVGSNDLLVAMGKAGQFDDPDIIAAQDRVIAAAKKYGKFAGCGGNRDVARQVEAIRRGAQFVTTQTDIGFLMASANAWTKGVREALATKGG
jgi:2-keto-3-deoxy-L-rhamnonate aldolase RhmA